MAMLMAVAATTFAYDGMYAASYMSGEVKNPKRAMPIGLIATAIIVLVLYMALTTVSGGLVDIDTLASSGAPIAKVAEQLPFIGQYAGTAVTIMAVLVILGSMSSVIMYQPRMGYAMAKDGYFFKFFSVVHKKYNTPYGAITAHCVFAIILTFFGNLSDILIYVTLISLIKNFIAVGSIFILRNKESYNPSYRCPGGIAFPLISCILNAILIVVTLITYPIGSVVAFVLLVGSGLIAFYLWERKKNQGEK